MANTRHAEYKPDCAKLNMPAQIVINRKYSLSSLADFYK